ncbi:MAG: MerR family transcriptional regulator [Lachnospiraceae bacterium]|nr:MerR family transcriptional regulator [Lachnospiraceae bacterium]
MLYTVGEMAKELGIPASTLRYYDQEGLLPFVKRSSSGMRMFTDADYETLMVIGYLKKSGLSIKEIKAFISMAAQGDASIKDRLTLFRGRRDAVRKQILELQETLSLLEYKCWYYETAQKAGTESVVRALSPENIPREYRDARCRLNITHNKEQE